MHTCFLNLVIERYSPVSGGALATGVMQKTRRLLTRGHTVTVLTPAHGDTSYVCGDVVPLRTESRETLSIVQRLGARARDAAYRWDWPYYEYYAGAYRQSLRSLASPPDAVIVLNDLIAPHFVRRALPHTRIISSLHNEVGSRCRLLPQGLAAVDHFITVSRYIRDWAIRTYGLPADRVSVVPNGSDPETFFPRETYLEPAERVRALFIGRLNEEKAPDLLADAVVQLKGHGLPIDLTVAGARWWYGNETADPYVRALLPKLDHAGARYLGHVVRADVPALLRAQDVVCVPSRWNEPFGQVVMEAMASGCAVVASDRGGLPDACGGAALLFDPSRPEELAGHLRRLCVEPALLAEQKRRSLKRALALTWDHNVDLLERVCAGSPLHPAGSAAGSHSRDRDQSARLADTPFEGAIG